MEEHAPDRGPRPWPRGPSRAHRRGNGQRKLSQHGRRGERGEKGDMRIADAKGIISSIICGPDSRTAIGPDTKDILFTVYASAGIGTEPVRSHLEDIQRFVRIVAPGAVTEELDTCSAD